MARSVSYATNSVVISYRDVSDIEDPSEWDDFVEWVRKTAEAAWPSFGRVHQWIGREDLAVLANDHALIGVSEYGGLASVWLVIRDDAARADLAEHWAEQVSPRFHKLFDELRKLGMFSNGEAIFERLNA